MPNLFHFNGSCSKKSNSKENKAQEKQKELKNPIQNWSDRKGCQYSGDNLEKIHQG